MLGAAALSFPGNTSATPQILLVGDSWGTDVGGSGAFDRYLKAQNCDFKMTNIAVGGTTTDSWDHGRDLEKLKKDKEAMNTAQTRRQEYPCDFTQASQSLIKSNTKTLQKLYISVRKSPLYLIWHPLPFVHSFLFF